MSFISRFYKGFSQAHQELSPHIKTFKDVSQYISWIATPVISTALATHSLSPGNQFKFQFIYDNNGALIPPKPSIQNLTSIGTLYPLVTSEISAHIFPTPLFNFAASLASLTLGTEACIKNTINLFVITPIVKEAVCSILPNLAEIPISALSAIYGFHQALTHSDADVAAKTSAVSLSGEIVFLDEIL